MIEKKIKPNINLLRIALMTAISLITSCSSLETQKNLAQGGMSIKLTKTIVATPVNQNTKTKGKAEQTTEQTTKLITKPTIEERVEMFIKDDFLTERKNDLLIKIKKAELEIKLKKKELENLIIEIKNLFKTNAKISPEEYNDKITELETDTKNLENCIEDLEIDKIGLKNCEERIEELREEIRKKILRDPKNDMIPMSRTGGILRDCGFIVDA